MKKRIEFPLAILMVAFMLSLGGSFTLQARSIEMYPQAAVLTDFVGIVKLKLVGTSEWIPVKTDKALVTGDTIFTGDLSSANIVFFDGSQMALYSNTTITVSELSGNEDHSSKIILLKQWWGKTRNRVERLLDSGSRYEIETPTAVTAVRGTDFSVDVAANGTTQVDFAEGIVDVSSQGETVSVKAGQQTSVAPGTTSAATAPNEVQASAVSTVGNTDDSDSGGD
ncbi:MAG: FecR domain-containing protein [Desulfuromusa sp.]|nr:FecR domain-containing protein [Desulfuromusa sp.]